jgi:hypothetical protein
VFFGEVYGRVQDLRYDSKPGDEFKLVMLDVMDLKTRKYWDVAGFNNLMASLDLPTAPVLHHGPWSDDLRSLANGKTTVGGDHVREGIVVRPIQERWNDSVGRVILKLHGEDYLLRKEKK